VVYSRQRNTPSANVYYDNIVIPEKSHAKFLGVILDCKLTGHAHCDHVVAKCEKNLNILRCLTGVWWGAHPYSLKLVYNALVRSVLDYGTFLLEPCNITALKRLDKIQYKALRIITGAMKSSPVNALQVECSDPPLSLRRQLLSDRFLFKISQYSKHQLHPKIQKLSNLVNTSPFWRHKTTPCLIKSYNKLKEFTAPVFVSERLAIYNHNFYINILIPTIYFDLNIDRNNADSTFNTVVNNRWLGWHHIFADASKNTSSGRVGIGVYHKQYNIVQKIKFPSECSVFTGECFGIVKALDYILSFNLKKSVIFSDCKSALASTCKISF